MNQKIKINNTLAPSYQSIESCRNPRIDMSVSSKKDRETGVRGEAKRLLCNKVRSPRVIDLIVNVVERMKASDMFKEKPLHYCVEVALSAHYSESQRW